MKPLLFLATSLFLTSCAAGPTIYTKVTRTDHRGNPYETTAPVFKLDSDTEGDLNIQTPDGFHFTLTTPRDANGNILVAEKIITSKKGDVVLGTERIPVVARVSTSPVVAAKGQATRGAINAISSAVATGVATSTVGAAVVPAATKIP